mgnify:CR=1 FL=1
MTLWTAYCLLSLMVSPGYVVFWHSVRGRNNPHRSRRTLASKKD